MKDKKGDGKQHMVFLWKDEGQNIGREAAYCLSSAWWRTNHGSGSGILSFITTMKDKSQADKRRIVLHNHDERQNMGRQTANCPS